MLAPRNLRLFRSKAAHDKTPIITHHLHPMGDDSNPGTKNLSARASNVILERVLLPDTGFKKA